MKEIVCQDKKITIRRRMGSRRLRLSVNKNGRIYLTIPFLCPRQVALRFVESHQDWIQNQLSKRRPTLAFKDGMSLSVLGTTVTIHHISIGRQPTLIQDNLLLVGGDITFLNRRVTDFIKHQTALYIEEKARLMADRLGQRINRITLKDTTSRWGSCSGKKNLNFCWRLGLAPLYVLDYLIAHEVAHLQEMNHSDRFWRVVSTLCDRRSDAEIWLRRNGHTLR